MSVIKLESKNKKPDLKVNYLGTDYILPGNISAALLEKLISVKDEDGEQEFLKAFLSDVVPSDFKKVLNQEDIAQLVPIWMEHIQGPKEPSSKS
jgi:hypothetical protein